MNTSNAQCDFKRIKNGVKCRVCGREVKVNPKVNPELIQAACKVQNGRRHKIKSAPVPTQTDGPGTQLRVALEDMGVPSCQACKDLARQMDLWGPDLCKQNIDQIIANILPRARQWMQEGHPWVHRVLPNVLEDFGLRLKIKSYVLKAIEDARNKTPFPVKPHTNIAVIVATYNCAAYLRTCLNSLLAQTMPVEIIVVDDASTDNTQEILKDFPQITQVRHRENLGANAARNSGLLKTAAPWVIFADADADYHPPFVERLWSNVTDDVDLVYCSWRKEFSEDRPPQIVKVDPWDPAKLLERCTISMCSLLRRAAIPPVMLPTRKHGTDYIDDWPFWLSLADAGFKGVAVDEVLFTAWMRPEGKTLWLESQPELAKATIAEIKKHYDHLKPRARVVSRPIRVGIISPSFATGGVEQQILGMVKYTNDSIEWVGMALTEYAATDTLTCRQLARYMPIYGSKNKAKTRNDEGYVRRMGSSELAIKTVLSSADVVIVWGVKHLKHLVGNYSGKVILVSHGDGNSKWTRDILETSVDGATHFVGVSATAVAAFPKDLRKDVNVIWNGVELDRLVPTKPYSILRQEIGIPSGSLAVGFVGRFSEEKNPLAAAGAVAKLKRPAVAVYVGIGWNDVPFKKIADKMSGNKCIWVKPPAHIGNVYAPLDVVVCASESEGFGLTPCEAWAAGIPVVATPVGVCSLEDAPIVPVSIRAKPDEIADAIRTAADSQARQLVDRGRRFVWSRFTAAAMAQNWVNFIHEIAGAKNV